MISNKWQNQCMLQTGNLSKEENLQNNQNNSVTMLKKMVVKNVELLQIKKIPQNVTPKFLNLRNSSTAFNNKDAYARLWTKRIGMYTKWKNPRKSTEAAAPSDPYQLLYSILAREKLNFVLPHRSQKKITKLNLQHS